MAHTKARTLPARHFGQLRSALGMLLAPATSHGTRHDKASFPFARRIRLEPLEDRRMLSTLFVDADALSGGDGLSWSTAFDDLQSALDSAAVVNGDADPGNDVEAIWIAEGTYRPSAELEPGDPRSASFSLVDGVTLFGGFTGTESTLVERDWSANETVLSGDLGVVDNVADNAYTVVYCGEDVEAGVDGVAVVGGNADGSYQAGHTERASGGAVFNSGTLMIANSVLLENASGRGGAVYNTSGALTVVGSTISLNTAEVVGGGGIYNDSGTVLVSGSTLSENSTAQGEGGGICNREGDVTIADSIVSDCTANSYGGGISNRGTITVVNSTLSGNSARDGGGIYSSITGSLTVIGSTLLENAAENDGGGIANYRDLSVTASSLLGNTAASYGGGIFNGFFGTMTVANCVLSGNSAGYFGGGVRSYSSGNTTVIVNSTIVGNSATYSGGGIDGRALALANCIVTMNEGGDVNEHGFYFEESTNNLIGVDPGFVRNPRTNGFDDYGDLRLTGESPAIDAGDTAQVPQDNEDIDDDGNTDEPLPFDRDGAPRVFGLSVDIGAYEFQNAQADGRETASTVVNTVTDALDLYDDVISLRDAIYYAQTDPLGGTIAFAPELSGSTILLAGVSLYIDRGITVDASDLSEGLLIDAAESGRAFTIGGIDDAPVTLAGLSIKNGNTVYGGGIYNTEELTIRNCTISENTARSGGAIYNSGGTLTVVNSVLKENAAEQEGGAIYSLSGTVVITHSKFMGNAAGSNGGGVHTKESLLSVENSVFVGNTAAQSTDHGYGGGICSDSDPLTIENSTFSGNVANGSGGGVYCRSLTLRNSILASNEEGDLTATLSEDSGNNLVGAPQSPLDPGFIRPPSDGGDGWGDNPATSDIDESANDDYGDLCLLPDSPAIDAGRNDLLPPDAFDLDADGDITEPIPFDLTGNARVENGTVDMGAYEYVAPALVPGDLNGDEVVNSADLDIIRANWRATVLPGTLFYGDPSGDGVVDSADLDIVRANWGNTVPTAAAVDAVLGEEESADASVYGPRARKNGISSEAGSTSHIHAKEDVLAAAIEAWNREWRGRFRRGFKGR